MFLFRLRENVFQNEQTYFNALVHADFRDVKISFVLNEAAQVSTLKLQPPAETGKIAEGMLSHHVRSKTKRARVSLRETKGMRLLCQL